MKIKIIAFLSFICTNAVFTMNQGVAHQHAPHQHRHYSCCKDGVGDTCPPVVGTFGAFGAVYKIVMCGCTYLPSENGNCCYKFGCDYSWFPKCNQTVNCAESYGGGSCQGAPAQWITTGLIFTGCLFCLPWTVEKCLNCRN